MKNSADQGGCYPQRPKAEVDNNLRDLQNSSYLTKPEFNNRFIIHSKYFLVQTLLLRPFQLQQKLFTNCGYKHDKTTHVVKL